MATKITITIADDLSPQERADAEQIIRDGVWEFISARMPMEDYINSRYANTPLYTDKSVSVPRRLAVAEKMKWNAKINVEIVK